MALIDCPECNAEVSDAAESCPECGFPIGKYVEKKKRERRKRKQRKIAKRRQQEREKKRKKRLKIVGIAALVIVGFCMCCGALAYVEEALEDWQAEREHQARMEELRENLPQKLETVDGYIHQGEFEKSEELLSELEEAAPENEAVQEKREFHDEVRIELHLNWLDTDLEEGSLQEAEELLTTLEDNLPDDERVKERRERFDEKQAQQRIRSAQDSLEQGKTYQKEEQWSDAVREFSSALESLDAVGDDFRDDEFEDLQGEAERAKSEATANERLETARGHFDSGNEHRDANEWIEADDEYANALRALEEVDEEHFEYAHRQLRNEIQSTKSRIEQRAEEAREEQKLQEMRDAVDDGDVIDAWSICQVAARKELRSPSSADFAPYYEVRGGPTTTDGRWAITGSVEADNAFGAKIRSEVVCELQRVNGDFEVIEAGIVE